MDLSALTEVFLRPFMRLFPYRKAGAVYFVSRSGDDSNDGLSPETPWRSLERVNSEPLGPGDTVLLRGGDFFTGTIRLSPGRCGAAGRPLAFSSYGSGRATIDAGDGTGVDAVDCDGIILRKLVISGSGRLTNQGCGIVFNRETKSGGRKKGIVIDGVEVSGFGDSGVAFRTPFAKAGFQGVSILNCVCRGNGYAGMMSKGPRQKHPHADLTVRNCVVRDNTGIPGYGKDTDEAMKHNGDGMVFANVDRCLIEHCLAFNNGFLCDAPDGPVGIWAYDSNRVTIQFCESHHNHTAGKSDGGGFDLDSHTTNSVMQYNYSHDNDGIGFLVSVGGRNRGHRDNVIRYNISENDGRKNGTAGIIVYGISVNMRIHNNTVWTSPAAHGEPKGIVVWYGRDEKRAPVRVYNNVFASKERMTLVLVEATQKDVRFEGNCYYCAQGPALIDYHGRMHEGLDAWRRETGQEKVRGKDAGIEVDPMFLIPGEGGTIDDTTMLDTLEAYKLRKGSPLSRRGVDLKSKHGIDPGLRDFFGTSLPRGPLTPGAFEFPYA